jgi:hypothetical protein
VKEKNSPKAINNQPVKEFHCYTHCSNVWIIDKSGRSGVLYLEIGQASLISKLLSINFIDTILATDSVTMAQMDVAS